MRGVDTGMRGKEGVRTGRVSTILCQFFLYLVSLSSLLSSSILSARSIDASATGMPLFNEERGNRRTNFTVSEERSRAEASSSFSSEKK